MARILAISSQVARGSVGLSIIVPALQALGHEVIALPTIVLSNHPGHPHVAGTQIDPSVLHTMLHALEANGWLESVDGILTGYLPSVEHVRFAAAAVARIKSLRGAHAVTYLCDPVLGDDPKGLYIAKTAAEAIRDQLIPLADLATPNRFELSYLNSTHIKADVRSAESATECHLDCGATFATSIPSDRPGETMNVMAAAGLRALTRVPLRPNAPNGTGDLFSGLLLSAWIAASRRLVAGEHVMIGDHALAFATAGVDTILAASRNKDELAIPALDALRHTTLTWPIEQIGDRAANCGWVVLRP